MLQIHAKIIAAAAACQATCDIRIQLNGIRFEPLKEGVRAIATDGHRMIVLTDKNGTCDEPVTLNFDKAAITKMKNQKASTVTVTRLDEDTLVAKIVELNHVSAVEIVDATFPEWGTVMPDKLPTQSCQAAFVNAEYLGKFCDVAKILKVSGNGITVVHQKTNNQAVCIQFGAPQTKDLSVRGLIMPLRVDATVWAS